MNVNLKSTKIPTQSQADAISELLLQENLSSKIYVEDTLEGILFDMGKW